MYSLSFRLKSYFLYAVNTVYGLENVKFRIRLAAARRFYKKYNGDSFLADEAENVVWAYYPNKRMYQQNRTWDVCLMGYLAKSGKKFMVYEGADIGKFFGKNIFFHIHKDKLNLFNVENYAAYYQLITEDLEVKGNKTYPSYHDICYWENKVFMYNKFKELDISHPKTTIYSNFEELIKNENTFPFLIKVPHSSGSYGLFNVTDQKYLESLRTDSIIIHNHFFIVQERLKITMDLRVILAGDQIIHSYWRKNNDKSVWKTTSTSSGSTVDFGNFPEKWRQFIIDTFKKTGLITGAFDIGWQNDDIETIPYVFEVSPSYDVNPVPNTPEDLHHYGKFKKAIRLKNSYDRLFVEDTFKVKCQGVELFFKQLEAKKK